MKNKIFYQAASVFYMLLVIALLVIIGCKKDKETDDNTIPNAGVNNYILSLPPWANFSPTLPDATEEFEPISKFDCEDQLVQTTTPCSITKTPETIVTYNPGSEILYLGSLIQGDGYIGGLGSMKSLPIYQRAPITITISTAITNPNRLVENPNLATVTEAIHDLQVTADNTGQQYASVISFQKETSYSVDQLAISLGLSAKFMVGEARTKLGLVNYREKSTVSAYFYQRMFTVNMGIPQRPGDVFSDDFTQELLDEQISLGRIGPDNLPVYVSSIDYGRMMLFTMTSTYEADSMGFALDARWKNINGSIDARYQEMIDNSTFTLVTIGGDDGNALDFISNGEYGSFFEESPSLLTAVPISYTLRNLGDNDYATISETTAYDMVQYEPVSVATYNNEGDWKNAVQSQMEYYKWECNYENVYQADESSIFQDQANGQTLLGNKISFFNSNTGYPIRFSLENVGVDGSDLLALVFNDQEGFSYNSISIGDVGNHENDDFEIIVPDDNVFAIAFHMQENSPESGEYLEIHAVDENGDCQIGYITEGINGFYGIVSPVPLRRIWFNEDSGDDDIALDDLYFGYRQD